jgi:GNAT superfamily N-acetyltransferase
MRNNNMNYLIRRKTKEDCAPVVHVATVAWNETYKGIVDDDFLNKLYETEEQRAKEIYNKFNEEDNHQLVLEVDNNIVGFVNVGDTDDTNYDNCGELHAIYILGKYKGKGFGKKLFEAGIEELKKMGYDKMIIGCLVGNPSNDFYKHMGGKLIKTRIFEKLQLPENVYYFEKI